MQKIWDIFTTHDYEIWWCVGILSSFYAFIYLYYICLHVTRYSIYAWQHSSLFTLKGRPLYALYKNMHDPPFSCYTFCALNQMSSKRLHSRYQVWKQGLEVEARAINKIQLGGGKIFPYSPSYPTVHPIEMCTILRYNCIYLTTCTIYLL